MKFCFHEESFILAEKTQSAGIANSLTGDTLGEIAKKHQHMKIKFTDKIVAFIDVLGFSNIVYSQDNSRIQEYFSYVEERFHQLLIERKYVLGNK